MQTEVPGTGAEESKGLIRSQENGQREEGLGESDVKILIRL